MWWGRPSRPLCSRLRGLCEADVAESLEYILKVRGGQEGAAEVAKVREQLGKTGSTVEDVGKKSRSATSGLSSFSGGLKHLAGGLIAVGAGFEAWESAQHALEFTHELALGTNKLAVATGMSIEQSSQWVGVANAMKVPANQLGMTFTRVAAAAQKQEQSTGKSVTAFDRLGISTQFVNAHAHDFTSLMGTVVERFANLKGGPEKTALELEVFGRGWQSLNPLLREGTKGLNEQLEMAKKFGVELHGGSSFQLEELRKKELEATYAGDGLRLSFAEVAEGPLIEMLQGFSKLAGALRTGDWKAFDGEAEHMGEVISHLVETALPHVAETAGHLAPAVAAAFWRGFQHANLGGEVALGLLVAHKFGLDSMAFHTVGGVAMGLFAGGVRAAWGVVALAGGAIGTAFAGAFESATLAAMYAWDAVAVFAGPEVMAAMASAGAIAGGGFELAFVGALGIIAFELGKKLGEWFHSLHWHFDAARILQGKSPIWLTEGESQGESAKKADRRIEHLALGPHEQSFSYLNKGGGAESRLHAHAMHVHASDTSPQGAGHSGSESHVAPLAPGSLALGGDIVLKVDGRELARISKRQIQMAQAQGAE